MKNAIWTFSKDAFFENGIYTELKAYMLYDVTQWISESEQSLLSVEKDDPKTWRIVAKLDFY